MTTTSEEKLILDERESFLLDTIKEYNSMITHDIETLSTSRVTFSKRFFRLLLIGVISMFAFFAWTELKNEMSFDRTEENLIAWTTLLGFISMFAGYGFSFFLSIQEMSILRRKVQETSYLLEDMLRNVGQFVDKGRIGDSAKIALKIHIAQSEHLLRSARHLASTLG